MLQGQKNKNCGKKRNSYRDEYMYLGFIVKCKNKNRKEKCERNKKTVGGCVRPRVKKKIQE